VPRLNIKFRKTRDYTFDILIRDLLLLVEELNDVLPEPPPQPMQIFGQGRIPRVQGAGQIGRLFPLEANGTLPAVFGNGFATRTYIATGAGVLPGMQGSSEVYRQVALAGSALTPIPTGAGALEFVFPLDVAGVLPVPAGAGNVFESQLLVGDGVLPAIEGNGNVESTQVLFEGHGILPAAAGAGELELIKTLETAGTIPALTGAGELTTTAAEILFLGFWTAASTSSGTITSWSSYTNVNGTPGEDDILVMAVCDHLDNGAGGSTGDWVERASLATSTSNCPTSILTAPGDTALGTTLGTRGVVAAYRNVNAVTPVVGTTVTAEKANTGGTTLDVGAKTIVEAGNNLILAVTATPTGTAYGVPEGAATMTSRALDERGGAGRIRIADSTDPVETFGATTVTTGNNAKGLCILLELQN
jgi:hypothetical protein